MRYSRIFSAFPVLAVLIATADFAADVLPLKHGRYVISDTPCAQASRATTVPFDGRGFDVGDNGCKYVSKLVGKNRYQVTSDCSALGEGTSTDTYEIRSFTEFRINGEARARRWCAPSELPAWTRAVTVH